MAGQPLEQLGRSLPGPRHGSGIPSDGKGAESRPQRRSEKPGEPPLARRPDPAPGRGRDLGGARRRARARDAAARAAGLDGADASRHRGHRARRGRGPCEPGNGARLPPGLCPWVEGRGRTISPRAGTSRCAARSPRR
jgi:hypothetical protein